ncbi:MAG TPA: GHKL domain-containing protein [Bacteroidetes bacterium]|nr:GHKL domain-containing protein [Bacteroidota bacterium]
MFKLNRFKTILNYSTLISLLILIYLFIEYSAIRNTDNIRSKYKLLRVNKKEFDNTPMFWFGDLDQNGADEFIVYGDKSRDNKYYNFRLYKDLDDKPLRYYPFKDRILRRVAAIDINFDGVKEILLPFLTKDSIKICIMDCTGKKIKDIPLLKYDSRSKSLPYIFFRDAIRYHGKTLLVYRINHINPTIPVRGLYVSDLQGNLIWKKPFASYLKRIYPVDLDGDGEKEIVCLSEVRSKKYPVKSDFSDTLAYLIVFDLAGNQKYPLKTFAGESVELAAAIDDFSPDNHGKEIALSVRRKSRSDPGQNELYLFGKNGNVLQNKVSLNRIWGLFSYDFKGDGNKEICAIYDKRILLVYDHSLKEIAKRDNLFLEGVSSTEIVKRKIMSGKENVALITKTSMAILDQNLYELFHSSMNDYCDFYRVKSDDDPFVTVYRDRSRVLSFYQIKRNKNYYFFRLFFLFLGGTLGLVLFRSFLFLAKDKKQITLERLLRLALNKEFELGIGVFDKNGKLISTNPRMKVIFNRDFSSLYGKKYDDIFTVLNPPLKGLIGEIYQNNYSYLMREIQHRSGGVELEIKVLLYKLDHSHDPELDSDFILLVAEDITELIRSKRLGAWMSMAQRYAHDVKTPLSTVFLTLQRIEMELENDEIKGKERYYHYLNYAKEEVSRIRNVTNGFLKFVRAEKMNKMPTDFASLIREVIDNYRIRLPEGIEFNLKLNEELASILLDREQFKVVFENLFDNAINSISDRGAITVTTDLIEEVKEDSGATHRQLLIEIADTGRGIPQSDLNEVYQPYYSSSAHGSGLGLMIVRRIIEDHDGTIFIRSQEGIGTVVILKIPA